VLTEHHPLLGTWTSASLSGDVEINNPGALLYYLLAVPARIDPEAGLVVGVVVLHLATVALAGWFAWRRGRPRWSRCWPRTRRCSGPWAAT
jgi:threonine/homoserine/homoserine lactone efflux protein